MSFLIGQPPTGTDPIKFLLDLLKNYAVDDEGKQVPVVTTYPKDLNGIPRVAIFLKNQTTKWISIPAERQRWYAHLNVIVWETSVTKRYAVETSIRQRIKELTKPTSLQLALNYVFMYIESQTPADNIMGFGQPIFRVELGVQVVYDILHQ